MPGGGVMSSHASENRQRLWGVRTWVMGLKYQIPTDKGIASCAALIIWFKGLQTANER
jgi:hypothetical protein